MWAYSVVQWHMVIQYKSVTILQTLCFQINESNLRIPMQFKINFTKNTVKVPVKTVQTELEGMFLYIKDILLALRMCSSSLEYVYRPFISGLAVQCA